MAAVSELVESIRASHSRSEYSQYVPADVYDLRVNAAADAAAIAGTSRTPSDERSCSPFRSSSWRSWGRTSMT